MSQAARHHTTSGIESYDHAEWEEWAPEVVDCVLDPMGVSAAYQRGAPLGRAVRNEVVATPGESCLLLWENGSPLAMETRFAGKLAPLQLHPGEGVFLPKNTDTWWVAEPSSLSGIMHLHFASGLIDRVAQEMGSRLTSETLPLISNFSDPAVRSTAQALFREARRQPPTALLWDSGTVFLTGQILSLMEPSVAQRSQIKGGLAPWQLRRVNDYLGANFSSKVSLGELAAVADLSVFHFARAFKATAGISPHARLVELRVRRGCELLATTDLSVTEIALEVGYESSQSFARAFRDVVKISPGEYRRARR